MSADWPLRKISDVCEFLNSKRVPLKSLDRDKRQGKYPYYGASGVVDHIDGYIFDGTHLLISEDGENLRSRKTPIAFKATGKFWVNNHAHILAEKEDGILDYLEYFFSKFDLTPYITGAVQPKLNKANLDTIEIPIPPSAERLFVNGVLNAFTEKIELNRQTNQTLESIAQAIFKSWFVDFDPTRAKAQVRASVAEGKTPGSDQNLPEGFSKEDEERLVERAAMAAIAGKPVDQLNTLSKKQLETLKTTAALFPDKLVESELGEIPDGWLWGELRDIAKFSTDRISVSKLSLETYISTENMLEGKKGISHASSLPAVKTVPSFHSGQILISNIRPYFMKIWLARFEGGRSNDVLGVEANERESTEYLYNLLYQDTFFDFMLATSKGAKMPRGDKDAIMGWHCVQPTLEVKRAYSKTIKEFYSAIDSTNKENKTLEQLRDTLLPKLLSGELAAGAEVAV